MKKYSKILGRLALSSAAALAGASAFAGTATDNLSVTASVADNCTVSTAAVAFGAYDPISANSASDLDGSGTVTVTCTNGASVTVALGQGENPAGTSSDAAPERQLVNGSDATNYLSYSLFSDSGRTTVWGNDATVDVSTTGTGAEDAHTVYGRIAKNQTSAKAGSYADTVGVTVSF